MKIIKITEDKKEKMSDYAEKMLRYGGKLMQCIEELDEGHMGERDDDEEDWDDEEWDEEDEDEDWDEEGFDFGDEDSIIYEVECACGERIAFDEETLEAGSMTCPNCGELLEFSLEEDEDEE